MASRGSLLSEFEQATSGDPLQPVALTPEDRKAFQACVTDGGLKSLSLLPRYLRLFRRVALTQEVWANGATHLSCAALADFSQVPADWALDRPDQAPSVVSLLAGLWVDLLRANRLKVKVWTAAGAACSGSLPEADRSKAARLVSRHQAYMGVGPVFLSTVPNVWLLPTIQGLFSFADYDSIIAFSPRILGRLGQDVVWEGLANLGTLADAYLRAGREGEGNTTLGLSAGELDDLRPELLPPFADGRHIWFREMPVRAWARALLSLARLRQRAANSAGAVEAFSRAWAVSAAAERELLQQDPDLGSLVRAPARQNTD